MSPCARCSGGGGEWLSGGGVAPCEVCAGEGTVPCERCEGSGSIPSPASEA
jgi:hypothetical protein